MKDLKYLGTLLKILFKVDKRFLVTTVIETVVFAVLPFVQLYLTKQSVTMLTSGETYRNYRRYRNRSAFCTGHRIGQTQYA